MTEVTAVPARDIGAGDFADIAPDVKDVEVAWTKDGSLRVTFDGDLTKDQAAAVRRRIMTADDEEEALRALCEAFLATDPDTLDLPTLARSGQVLVRLVLKLRTA